MSTGRYLIAGVNPSGGWERFWSDSKATVLNPDTGNTLTLTSVELDKAKGVQVGSTTEQGILKLGSGSSDAMPGDAASGVSIQMGHASVLPPVPVTATIYKCDDYPLEYFTLGSSAGDIWHQYYEGRPTDGLVLSDWHLVQSSADGYSTPTQEQVGMAAHMQLKSTNGSVSVFYWAGLKALSPGDNCVEFDWDHVHIEGADTMFVQAGFAVVTGTDYAHAPNVTSAISYGGATPWEKWFLTDNGYSGANTWVYHQWYNVYQQPAYDATIRRRRFRTVYDQPNDRYYCQVSNDGMNWVNWNNYTGILSAPVFTHAVWSVQLNANNSGVTGFAGSIDSVLMLGCKSKHLDSW